jgi:hypothetical protein
LEDAWVAEVDERLEAGLADGQDLAQGVVDVVCGQAPQREARDEDDVVVAVEADPRAHQVAVLSQQDPMEVGGPRTPRAPEQEARQRAAARPDLDGDGDGVPDVPLENHDPLAGRDPPPRQAGMRAERGLDRPRGGRGAGRRERLGGARLRYPLRACSSSMSWGTTLSTSPTTPRSASLKIGASASLLMATMFLLPFMPTVCCMAPLMPQAM